MTYLIAGIVLFFGPHLFTAFRSRAPEKDLKRKLGYGPYMGLYSLVTIAGLVLIVIGYGDMRPSTVIWTPPEGLKHLNVLLQLIAFIILFTAYTPTGYIRKTLKHPMLVGVKIWALGHLLANGELNSIILFGSFLAYAVIDRIVLKKRGDNGPPADLKPQPLGDVIAVIMGVGFWAAMLLWLHPVLFGMPALPQG